MITQIYKNTLIVLMLLLGLNVYSQNDNFKSRSSIGLTIGGSYYIGDLNRFGHFKRTNLSAGIIYKYHINSRLEIRGGLRYGKVEGYDSDAKDEVQRARNLSFQSNIFELGVGIEFNYLDYKIGNSKYFWTPYLFVEIAGFHMNPKAHYNGELVALQPIGTEGQGSSLSSRKPYSLIQMAFPIGIGVKFNIGKWMSASVEYGIRFLFTDYLDDVGKGEFINREELSVHNGPISANLADRSLPDYTMSGTRGNIKTRDWYSMFGVTLSFSLGKQDNCFYQ
ncbi:MAG: DUF6089 family protein [Brumimicrobium sp.]